MTLAVPNRSYLHAGQRSVFSDHHRFKVVVAGRRWGKTRLSELSILDACAKPRQLVWYVAPTYGMARAILWDELRELIPKEWVRKVNETRMAIFLHNGTRVELKGADKPDTLRGVGLNHLIIDEAQDIKETVWRLALRPTLVSTRGTALIIGTPKSFNWLYDLYMLGQRGETYINANGVRRRNAWRSWQFPTITSPFIPPEEIESARADLDDKSFRQEFEASFETMSGRVFYAFDRKVHVGKYAFNPHLPIWVGQDFNIDPMSSVIMQPQGEGVVWIIDEAVLFSSNTEEVAEEIARRYHKHINQVTFYPDPAGQARGHARGESDLDILREAGFTKQKFRRKHPRIADRVNATNRMFKSADGAVHCYIDERCKHTITAFEQTQYKPGTREIDKAPGIEHPADGAGYCFDIEFPVRKIRIAGISL